MIGSLRGTLQSKDAGAVVIDVGGVGYEVQVGGSLLAAKLEEPVTVIVYTDVRENAIQLFGFSSALEKQVFLLLKKVKGVGSRLAMNVLSGVGAEELLLTIGRSDVTALTRVPGIGKKTAERLIVELREQVGQLAYEAADETAAVPPPRSTPPAEDALPRGPQTDALLALEKLGFGRDRAQKAIEAAVEEVGGLRKGLDSGELLRNALGRL